MRLLQIDVLLFLIPLFSFFPLQDDRSKIAKPSVSLHNHLRVVDRGHCVSSLQVKLGQRSPPAQVFLG